MIKPVVAFALAAFAAAGFAQSYPTRAVTLISPFPKIAGIQMMQMTGTDVVFIPFKGAGPAMQAMLGARWTS